MSNNTVADLLADLENYFDNKADADHDEDGFIPNEEMKFLSRIKTMQSSLPHEVEQRAEQMNRAISALALELPGPVWMDVNRIWQEYKISIQEGAKSAEPIAGSKSQGNEADGFRKGIESAIVVLEAYGINHWKLIEPDLMAEDVIKILRKKLPAPPDSHK